MDLIGYITTNDSRMSLLVRAFVMMVLFAMASRREVSKILE